MLYSILLLQVMPKQAFAPPIKYILCAVCVGYFQNTTTKKALQNTATLMYQYMLTVLFITKTYPLNEFPFSLCSFLPVFLYSVDGYIMQNCCIIYYFQGNLRQLLTAAFSSLGVGITAWKFHNFHITEILREINFEDSRSAKSSILTHLEALNCYFYEFLQFLKAQIYQIVRIQSF